MKKHNKIYLLTLFLVSMCFNQNAELITQQITIEEAIKNKVDAVVNKFLNPAEYITIVNARLDFKPLSLESTDESSNQVKSESTYSVIPGLMPSIPTRQSIYRQGGSSKAAFNYSTDKYILYQLEIIIYLNENISTGSLQTNIKTLVLQNLQEIECEECIRFETMDLGPGAQTTPDKMQELLQQIEGLKEQMRAGQIAIKDNQINELEDINAKYIDQVTGFEDHLKEQDRLRKEAEEARMLRLEQAEKNYRVKQDSLYILTSIKLDEAVRGRIQSEETTKKELLNLIKMQIQGDGIDMSNLSDNAQSDLFTKKPSMRGGGLSAQMWLMILCLILLMAVLLIMVMKNKDPIYLKPKAPVDENENENGSPPENNLPYEQTQANESEEVQRSELQSLRQSAVSMSVSEKAGANQIVQDWLDDGPTDQNENKDQEDTQQQEEKKE